MLGTRLIQRQLNIAQVQPGILMLGKAVAYEERDSSGLQTGK